MRSIAPFSAWQRHAAADSHDPVDWRNRSAARRCSVRARLRDAAAAGHRRSAAVYENAFVATVSDSLRRNFVVANPRSSVPDQRDDARRSLSSSGYAADGTLSAQWRARWCRSTTPRLTVNYFARRRTRQFVYQLPDALLALASALRAGSNLTKGLELLATRQPPPLSAGVHHCPGGIPHWPAARGIADGPAPARQYARAAI